MEYGFEARRISHLYLRADEWLRQEQTADLIVPDSSPDAVSVADCFAVVCVRSAACRDGCLQIAGGIQAGVLYRAEGESKLRFLETYCPFTMQKDSDVCMEDGRMLYQCRVTGCDARIINSRKILLRIELGCDVRIYQEQELEICEPDETDPDLQLLTETESIKVCQDFGQKLFSIEESFDLPAGNIPMQRLLRCCAHPKILESRVAGAKTIFKGIVGLELLYQSTEDTLEQWQTQLPFSQYCDLQSDWDDADAQICLQLSGCDAVMEDASQVSVSLMLQAQCLVVRQVETERIIDAYHLKGPAELQIQTDAVDQILGYETCNLPVRVQGSQPMQTVLDVQALPGKPEQYDRGAEHGIKIPVSVKLCGMDAEGQYVFETVRTEAILQTAWEKEGFFCMDHIHCGEIYAGPGPGGADIRFTVELPLLRCQKRSIRTVRQICVSEVPAAENRPSLLLRTVLEDTSIWDLAKEAGTTRERIRSANEIQEDKVAAGTLLLIPMR